MKKISSIFICIFKSIINYSCKLYLVASSKQLVQLLVMVLVYLDLGQVLHQVQTLLDRTKLIYYVHSVEIVDLSRPTLK